jgi:hypothetical protein
MKGPIFSAEQATTATTGQIRFTWCVPMVTDVELHRDSPAGPLLFAGTGPGSIVANSIQDGAEFFLQDVTGGKSLTAHNTIAHIQLHLTPHENIRR